MVGYVAAAACLCAAALFFSFHPSTVFWALSNGADITPAARTAWFLAGGAVFLPLLFPGRAAAAVSLLRRARVRGVLGAVLLAALLFALFQVFRSRNHFLGDGWLVITLLERDQDPIVARPGMGTLLVHRALFRLLRGIGPGEERVFAILSSLAGAFYVFLAARWARLAARSLSPKETPGAVLFLAAPALTVGTMQLFFGYVENYALAHLFLLAFLVAGSHATIRGGSRIPATLLFFLSVLAHWAVLALFPALLVLWMRPGEGRFKGALSRLPEAGAALVLLAPPFLSQARLLNEFNPWIGVGDWAPYGLLSLRHLALSANFALLLAPLPILLFFLGGRSAERPREAEPLLRFLRMAALSGIALFLVVRPFLGPRDWDLLSFCMTPLALWAPASALSRVRPDRVLAAGSCAAVFGLFMLAPWVLGNTTVRGGAERVARMVVHDPQHYFGQKPKIVGLAWVMAERGAPETAFRLFREAVRVRPENAVAQSDLGILYWQQGKYREALPHFEAAVRADSSLAPPLYYLGTVRFHLKEGDLGEEALRRFLERAPRNPSAESYLGRVLMMKGRWEEALDHLLVSRHALPENADLNAWIAMALDRLGRKEEAVPYLRRALEKDPNHEDARRLLGEITGESRGGEAATAKPGGR